MTAIVDTEYSIDRATGNIRVATLVENHTVLEFYEWLRKKGAELVATNDDLYDITDPDIAEKKFETIINLKGNTNIDLATAKTLYKGSIVQDDGVIWDGITVIAPQGTSIDIIQNGAKVTDFWSTSYNPDAAQGISHRFLIQVADTNGDIDGRRLLGQTRQWGYDYVEFLINGTSRGENSLPLATKADLNNTTSTASIAAMSTIVVTEGYTELDVDNDGTVEPYMMSITKGTRSMNDLYEKMKYITRSGSSSTIFGLAGDLFRGVTHELDVSVTGTLAESTSISWGTGTGQILAVNTAQTKVWIQLLTGIAPTTTDTLTQGANTATISAVVDRVTTIAKPFVGASTGTALIGGYGVGIAVADLSAADKLTDLTNNPRQPPNSQKGFVGNLIVGASVLVALDDGTGSFDYSQFTIASKGTNTITVNEVVDGDTPATGSLRVFDGSNRVPLKYTAVDVNTKTFTIDTATTPITAEMAVGNACFIGYIDEVATDVSAFYQANYAGSDKSLICQVRFPSANALKTFNTPVTFTSTGFSVNALQLPD